jgi:hypothetical protein
MASSGMTPGWESAQGARRVQQQAEQAAHRIQEQVMRGNAEWSMSTARRSRPGRGHPFAKLLLFLVFIAAAAFMVLQFTTR